MYWPTNIQLLCRTSKEVTRKKHGIFCMVGASVWIMYVEMGSNLFTFYFFFFLLFIFSRIFLNLNLNLLISYINPNSHKWEVPPPRDRNWCVLLESHSHQYQFLKIYLFCPSLFPKNFSTVPHTRFFFWQLNCETEAKIPHGWFSSLSPIIWSAPLFGLTIFLLLDCSDSITKNPGLVSKGVHYKATKAELNWGFEH